MKMTYKFDYLPAGLFNRSQSRLCQYSEGSKVWKKGSLLNKNNHLALVRQTKDKELSITVQGPRPENVLYLVHELLKNLHNFNWQYFDKYTKLYKMPDKFGISEKKCICLFLLIKKHPSLHPVDFLRKRLQIIETLIHDFFQGVNYDILLPCPDCTKVGTQDAHMFSSKQVKRATDLKAQFLQCAKLFHIISLTRMHAVMPPSSMSDYEQQIMRMVQDMNDLKQIYVCIICCSENNVNDKDDNKSNQVNKLHERLQAEKIACSLVEINEKVEDNVDDFGFKVSNATLILICISPEFCNSKKCADIFAFVRQSGRPVLFAIVGKGQNWKNSSVGLQIASEVYYDFQKIDHFDAKFVDLLNKIKIKTAKSKSAKYHEIFFSYCWSNSFDAIEKGRKHDESALGEVDPRKLADRLQNDLNLDVWIDYKQPDLGALFEDIADGLRHSQLFIACVSDEYLMSQNCLREFRFATAVQLPKILCVVGKGDNWQKSEINLLALDAFVYNFKIKSDETYNDLTSKIREIFVINTEKVIGDDNQTRISKTTKNTTVPTSEESVEKNLSAYRELTELAERKLLQQASSIASKLRATDIFFSKPYPRVFFVDLCSEVNSKTSTEEKGNKAPSEKQNEKSEKSENNQKILKPNPAELSKQKEQQKTVAVDKTETPKIGAGKATKENLKGGKPIRAHGKSQGANSMKLDKCETETTTIGRVERPRTASRPKSGVDVDLWDTVDVNDICFKWLCEYDGGWHTVGEPLYFKNLSLDSFSGGLFDFLDTTAAYESQMLSMLQHTPINVEILRHKRAQEFVNDLKLRASKVGPDGFETGYKFLYRLIRQLDTDVKKGGMDRCYLFSKKIIWLCADHKKLARGVLADDDLDTEDIAISFDSDDKAQSKANPLLISEVNQKKVTTDKTSSLNDGGKKSPGGMFSEFVGRANSSSNKTDNSAGQSSAVKNSKACEIM